MPGVDVLLEQPGLPGNLGVQDTGDGFGLVPPDSNPGGTTLFLTLNHMRINPIIGTTWKVHRSEN